MSFLLSLITLVVLFLMVGYIRLLKIPNNSYIYEEGCKDFPLIVIVKEPFYLYASSKITHEVVKVTIIDLALGTYKKNKNI